MTGQSFDIRQEAADGGAVRVFASGELDLATVGVLEDRITQITDAGRTVELVLAELSFIDASGLNSVISRVQPAGLHGRSIHVDRDVSPCVRRILELTGAGDYVWPVDPVVHGLLPAAVRRTNAQPMRRSLPQLPESHGIGTFGGE